MPERVVPGPLPGKHRLDMGVTPISSLRGRQLDWDKKEVIVEFYEHYLKAATWPPAMRVIKATGQDISKMTFDEWLLESVRNLEERIELLPTLAIKQALTQDDIHTNITIARLSLDVIRWFRALSKERQNSILNETSAETKDDRTPLEIFSSIERDAVREVRSMEKTPHQLSPKQMGEFLHDAYKRGKVLDIQAGLPT